MSGIYGDSAEDRHFERICDDYTDRYDGKDLCGLKKPETDTKTSIKWR
jgi:hypothetical protein